MFDAPPASSAPETYKAVEVAFVVVPLSTARFTIVVEAPLKEATPET